MGKKLLPCPFCGSPGAIIENIGRNENADRKYHVACNRYGCGLYGGLSSWHQDKSGAIDAWNQRTDNCNEGGEQK